MFPKSNINPASKEPVTCPTAFEELKIPMSEPTRASLLTGLYPTNAGIGNMGLETTVKEYQNYLRHDCTRAVNGM